MDAQNKSLYVLTNAAGAGGSFAGADASASWWHRNFRMLARLQKLAQTEPRVLAIAGQGHMAILKDLLRFDPSLKTQEVDKYL